MSDDALVLLTHAPDVASAGLIRDYLVEHGIYAFVKDQNLSSLYGRLAFVKIGIMVRQGDMKKAQELLESLDSLEAEPIGDAWKLTGEEADDGDGEDTPKTPSKLPKAIAREED